MPVRAAAAAALVLLVATPAAAQTVLEPGQTINGELSGSDARLVRNNAPMDCYILRPTPGATYTVTMRATTFDAQVVVGKGASCETMTNDLRGNGGQLNSGGWTNAEIVFKAEAGPYWVRAITFYPSQMGPYTLAVRSAGVVAPTPAPAPAPQVAARPAPAPSPATPPASTTASMARPTDPQQRAAFDGMCAAADLIAFMQVFGGLTQSQKEAWVPDGRMLAEAALASGSAVGENAAATNARIGKTAEMINKQAAAAPSVRAKCVAAHKGR